MRAQWEAYIQHINICQRLSSVDDPYVEESRNLDGEISDCLEKLNIENEELHEERINLGQKCREILRKRCFEDWCNMPSKGVGVSQYAECPISNVWMKEGTKVSSSEKVTMMKMRANVAPVAALPGRSQNNNTRCRRGCNEIETLGHIQGNCEYSRPAINSRHHAVCDLIARELRSKGLDVEREVRCQSNDGRERRVDLLVVDKKKKQGWILDPTIRIERDPIDGEHQFVVVDREKKAIYEPCVPYFLKNFKLNSMSVHGLFIGARGTISRSFVDTLKSFHVSRNLLEEIVITVVKRSSQITSAHLYNP